MLIVFRRSFTIPKGVLRSPEGDTANTEQELKR